MDNAVLKMRMAPAITKVSPPTEQALRHALGHFATGVTVVTALDEGGALTGLTVNAFSSVSLDPPLVLACLDQSVRCYRAISATRGFTVHILDAAQKHVAAGFARKGGDRNGICDWSVTEANRPLLSSFHAAFECSLHEAFPGGDHMIVIGHVERVHLPPEATAPLLYYRGRMSSFPGT